MILWVQQILSLALVIKGFIRGIRKQKIPKIYTPSPVQLKTDPELPQGTPLCLEGLAFPGSEPVQAVGNLRA
ncbi:MAG: hypothetical protein LBU25_06165 [Treponema sp.]|nr:hypothetical protein [Treponema sp.]